MNKELKIEVTPVFSKLWKAINNPKVRGIVLEGGSRSSKTWSIAQALYLYGLMNKDLTILATRQKYTWVRMSILATMQNVLDSLDANTKFVLTGQSRL